MSKRCSGAILLACVIFVFSASVTAERQPGESPALGSKRVAQDDIAKGLLNLREIREEGMRVFTTPFNKLDGYGDGPMDPADSISPGGRPTLQDNGTFLRVNGLDAQTCLECHSIVSNKTIPATHGIGGVGGSNNNAIFMPIEMDVVDVQGKGYAGFDGRLINPPFLFGSGGVELLGLEMTEELQTLKQQAIDNPGTAVELWSKGVYFGKIKTDDAGNLDTSKVEGVNEDLVIRPFGRKGEFSTVRAFDIDAMMFHFGMQPVEEVGDNIDADGDGVANEILVGEISALHVFATTLERPFQRHLSREAQRGRDTFRDIGCTQCHVMELQTKRRRLPYRVPEVPDEPFENIYYNVDLSRSPPQFELTKNDGLRIPLFSDLKRHNMGAGLAEDFQGATKPQNEEFITARLWGVADTAPYLHDGRATTLTEAILAHGGEAENVRDGFESLSDEKREDLLTFLQSLRTPNQPAEDLLRRSVAKDTGP